MFWHIYATCIDQFKVTGILSLFFCLSFVFLSSLIYEICNWLVGADMWLIGRGCRTLGHVPSTSLLLSHFLTTTFPHSCWFFFKLLPNHLICLSHSDQFYLEAANTSGTCVLSASSAACLDVWCRASKVIAWELFVFDLQWGKQLCWEPSTFDNENPQAPCAVRLGVLVCPPTHRELMYLWCYRTLGWVSSLTNFSGSV